MAKSNLIPVRRVDRNGVSAIRWVRPEQQGSTRTKMPAPTLKSPALETPRVLALFQRSGFGGADEMEWLKWFDHGVIRDLERVLRDVPEEFSFDLEQQVTDCMSDAYANPSLPTFNTDLSNLVVFSGNVMRPESQRTEISGLVAGLRDRMDMRDFRRASPVARRMAQGLVTVTARLDTRFVEGRFINEKVAIKSKELAIFVQRRPEDAEDIARIVNEHRVDDPEFVQEVLDHGSQSLRDGVL